MDKVADAEFSIIYRADSWDNVKEAVLAADHVFFACLALRANMHKKQYPYLEELVDSGIPFSVIASGTDLPVSKDTNIYEGFSHESISLLKKINDKAVVFTTRGGVSQEFCKRAGLDNAVFNGDVAFYDKKIDEINFKQGAQCKNIVVSDPHRAAGYLEGMHVLIDGLKAIFPDANIVVAQHGVNKVVEDFCKKNSIQIEKIYEDKYSGLKIYEEADLHVGFRVHAHVSALKRKKYSYLLEQDGRGCDYGSTIERKISVPNYSYSKTPVYSVKNLVKLLIGRPLTFKEKASVAPVYELLAMIRRDSEEGFVKFIGLEQQILEFNRLTETSIKKVLGGAECPAIV